MGRVTFPQLALAAALGVAGGLYVYKPIYQQYSREQSKAREPGPAPAQHKQAEGGESRRGNDAPES